MAEIHPMFVFEVALSIDLDMVERLLGPGSERQTFRHRGRSTTFFQYRPAPLRISQERASIAIHRWTTDPQVELVLYDFGAATVTYRLPVSSNLDELLEASVALRATDLLRQDAQGRVEALLKSVAAAVQRPRVADFMEDYTLIGMRENPGPGTAAEFCAAHAGQIARILRPAAGGLSPEEVHNATDVRIAFGPADVTIVDWDAAFALDPDPDDVRAVLEFANVQLLEMRWLDLQLDTAMERSYQLLSRSQGIRLLLPSSASADLHKVAELQLESAVMLERVSNALKVFGEEYLTRIYRLASARFHLGELDASITRKLGTIESIYQKLSDRASGVRMVALEWIVILLIASEIVLSLWHG